MSALLQRLIADHGSRCGYCRTEFTPTNPAHIDHVVPRAAGGGDERDNLLVACQTCNIRKGARNPIEWLEHLVGRGQPVPAWLPAQIVDVSADYDLELWNPHALLRSSDGESRRIGDLLPAAVAALAARTLDAP